MAEISVRSVGTARQAYDIQVGVDVFRIRTQSPRRYLVVSLSGRHVVKRTDSRDTAEQVRRAGSAGDRLVLDRRLIDAPPASESWAT